MQKHIALLCLSIAQIFIQHLILSIVVGKAEIPFLFALIAGKEAVKLHFQPAVFHRLEQIVDRTVLIAFPHILR